MLLAKIKELWRKLRSKLVDDIHLAWRWLSMQLMVLAALLEAFAQALKEGWIALPDDLKATVPGLIGKTIGFLIFAAILGRLWKQKPPEKN